MRRTQLLMIVSLLISMVSANAWGADEAGREKDHEALKGLLKTTQQAINTQNFETLKPYLAKSNLIVITVDGQKLESLDAFREYWKKLFESKATGLDRIEVNPIADGPTEFVSENVGVCHGTSNDRYFFKGGDIRTMPERWTAVALKEGPDWKLSRIIFSANILDNPVLGAIKQETERLILMAAIGGMVVGGLLAWLLLKKKA